MTAIERLVEKKEWPLLDSFYEQPVLGESDLRLAADCIDYVRRSQRSLDKTGEMLTEETTEGYLLAVRIKEANVD